MNKIKQVRSNQIAEKKEKEDSEAIKGTLMRMWKSLYMFVFIQKQYPENFTFLNL